MTITKQDIATGLLDASLRLSLANIPSEILRLVRQADFILEAASDRELGAIAPFVYEVAIGRLTFKYYDLGNQDAPWVRHSQHVLKGLVERMLTRTAPYLEQEFAFGTRTRLDNVKDLAGELAGETGRTERRPQAAAEHLRVIA